MTAHEASPKGVLDGARMIAFYPELMVCFGLCGALIIQQIHFYTIKGGNVRDGESWVYNSTSEWEKMLQVVKRSTIANTLRELESLGVIVVGVFNKFGFDKTRWFRLNYGVMASVMTQRLGYPCEVAVESHGLKFNPRRVKIYPTVGLESNPPIPEMFSESNTKKEPAQAEPSQELQPQAIPTTEESEVLPKNKPKVPKGPTSATEIQQKLHSPAAVKNEVNATEMYKVWATTVPKHCSSVKFVGPFNMKEKGQMSMLVKHWGADRAGLCLEYVLSHWISFAKYVKEKADCKGYPEVPTVDFLIKFKDFGMNFYLNRKKEPVQLAAQETSIPAPVPPVKKIGKITLKKGKLHDENCVTLAAEGSAPVETPTVPAASPVVEAEDEDKPITLEELLAMKPFIKVK